MDKTVTPELAVMFSECPKFAKHGGTSEHYSLRLCVIEEGEKVRNISCSRWENPHIDLRDLAFTVLVSWDREQFRTFGWHAHYLDMWSVGREEAEGMVRTFKRIERITKKHTEKYGHPQTFAAYVQMLAVGFGIKRMVKVVGRETNWHNQNEHEFLPIAELPSYIERSLAEAKAIHFPEKEVA